MSSGLSKKALEEWKRDMERMRNSTLIMSRSIHPTLSSRAQAVLITRPDLPF